MRKASPPQGFSLVELLVVLAIIALLGALIVPSITSALRGSALSQGGQEVISEIAGARQVALSQNRVVEVRFYRVAESGMPGEVAGNPATGKFRALQSFVYDSTGTISTALDKVQMLPDMVIMDSGSTLSTLLGSTQAKSWTASDPQIMLPVVGTSYNACVFDFEPDGSTNLNPIGQQWFVTLHGFTSGDNLTTLPVNFFTLQVDALNGHIQNYRP